MTKSEKPVPCGCGGNGTKYATPTPDMGTRFCVFCSRCYVGTENYETLEEAIAVWNLAMRGRQDGRGK